MGDNFGAPAHGILVKAEPGRSPARTFCEAAGRPSASDTRSPHFGHVPTTDTELGLR